MERLELNSNDGIIYIYLLFQELNRSKHNKTYWKIITQVHVPLF